MRKVLQLVLNDDVYFINKNEKLIIILFVTAIIIISIIFTVLATYCYKYIFSTYGLLRKSFHFIPYKRVIEDSTTKFLLKKILK